MAYDEGLAERIREQLAHRNDVVEKKMFGGLTFMVRDYMACGLAKGNFMLRVEKDKYHTYLTDAYAREMDFTGRALKGMLYIDLAGIEEDADLAKWVDRCLVFVDSLPAKKLK